MPCAAAQAASGSSPPDSKKQPSHEGRLFLLVREGGLARRARRRVAALERPRRSIHSRSRSSPGDQKEK